jgi:hypothetical protein
MRVPLSIVSWGEINFSVLSPGLSVLSEHANAAVFFLFTRVFDCYLVFSEYSVRGFTVCLIRIRACSVLYLLTRFVSVLFFIPPSPTAQGTAQYCSVYVFFSFFIVSTCTVKCINVLSNVS